MIRSVAIVVVLVAVTGCSSVAGTGRSQLNMVSSSQEVALGVEAFNEATADVTIITTGDEADMVRRIGKRIVDAAFVLYPSVMVEQEHWQFVLIDDDSVENAWAAPGGKVAIYTGLLPVTKTEAGLAVVVAHEVAHVLAHHSAEQISHALLMSGAMSAGSAALGDSANKSLIMQVLGVGGEYGVALPYSRLHESEADELGLFLMAEAGYDPRTAIDVWTRMADSESSRSPEFMSTHPSPGNRVEEFERLMPEAMELYREAERYRKRSKRLKSTR